MIKRKLLLSGFLMIFSTWVFSGTLYGISRGSDELVSVDLNTFVATTIGPLGTNEEFGGLAYDAIGDIMYMSGGRGNNSIYTINYTTGAATLLGAHGITDVFGLAYDSTNGVLYGSTTRNTLYSFSLVNGSATLIGTTGFNIGGLAYDSIQDRLIGISTGGNSIYEINRSTGVATLLQGSLPSTNDIGFTFDFDNNIFYSLGLNGTLHQYSPTNFAATQLASGLPFIDGLTFTGVLAPPSPPTLGMPQGIPSLSFWATTVLALLFALIGISRGRQSIK